MNIVIIILLAISFGARAVDLPKSLACAKSLDPTKRQAVQNRISVKQKLVTIPRDTAHLIGLLAHIGSSLHFLVGSYYAAHMDLLLQAQSKGKVHKLIWSGELQVRKGQILKANATSRMFYEYTGERSATPLDDFATVLRTYRPDLLAPNVKLIEYSDDQQHLTSETFSSRFRHDFRNYLNVLMGRMLLHQNEFILNESLLRVAKGILATGPFLQGRLHLDAQGINILSSWVNQPLPFAEARPQLEIEYMKTWVVIAAQKLQRFDARQEAFTRDIVLATQLH
jgi:hypothetical protein